MIHLIESASLESIDVLYKKMHSQDITTLHTPIRLRKSGNTLTKATDLHPTSYVPGVVRVDTVVTVVSTGSGFSASVCGHVTLDLLGPTPVCV
jgi:hypothetical protein